MFLDYCEPFISIILIVLLFINHFTKHTHQIFQFNLAINIIIIVLPSSLLLVLLEHWCFTPVGILQYSQQGIKMNLFHKGIFSFIWVWNSFADCAVFDGPVEVTIFQLILIFAEIYHFKLVFDSSYMDCVG